MSEHGYTDDQIRAALTKATEELQEFEISGKVDGTAHHDPEYWQSEEIAAVRSILKYLSETEQETTND